MSVLFNLSLIIVSSKSNCIGFIIICFGVYKVSVLIYICKLRGYCVKENMKINILGVVSIIYCY